MADTLNTRIAAIDEQLLGTETAQHDALKLEKKGLEKALGLIGEVLQVFESQQKSLGNLERLESAHEILSTSEEELASSYIKNPDLDGQVLVQKLEAVEQALVNPYQLAAQADESSRAIGLVTGRYARSSLCPKRRVSSGESANETCFSRAGYFDSESD